MVSTMPTHSALGGRHALSTTSLQNQQYRFSLRSTSDSAHDDDSGRSIASTQAPESLFSGSSAGRPSLNAAYGRFLAQAGAGAGGGRQGAGHGDMAKRDRRRRDGTEVGGHGGQEGQSRMKRGYEGEGSDDMRIDGWIGETLRASKKQRLAPTPATSPIKPTMQVRPGPSPRASRLSRPFTFSVASSPQRTMTAIKIERSPARASMGQFWAGSRDARAGGMDVGGQMDGGYGLAGSSSFGVAGGAVPFGHAGSHAQQASQGGLFGGGGGGGNSDIAQGLPFFSPSIRTSTPFSIPPQRHLAATSSITRPRPPFSTPYRRAPSSASPASSLFGHQTDDSSPVPYFATFNPIMGKTYGTRPPEMPFSTPHRPRDVSPAFGSQRKANGLVQSLSIILEEDSGRRSVRVSSTHGQGQDGFGTFWKRRKIDGEGTQGGHAPGNSPPPMFAPHENENLFEPQASPVLNVQTLEAVAAAHEMEEIARSVSSMSMSVPGSGSAMSQDSFSGKREAQQMPGRGYRKMTQRAMVMEQNHTEHSIAEKTTSNSQEEKTAPIGTYCPVITNLPRAEQSANLSDVDMESIRSFGERMEITRSQGSQASGSGGKRSERVPSVPALTFATTSEGGATASPHHGSISKIATPAKQKQKQAEFPEHQSPGFAIWMDED